MAGPGPDTAGVHHHRSGLPTDHRTALIAHPPPTSRRSACFGHLRHADHRLVASFGTDHTMPDFHRIDKKLPCSSADRPMYTTARSKKSITMNTRFRSNFAYIAITFDEQHRDPAHPVRLGG